MLFEKEGCDKSAIDRFEGVGYGYQGKTVPIVRSKVSAEEAIKYCATRIDSDIDPFSCYKQHFLVVVDETGLPRSYV